jgi:hypothetical protein
MINTQADIVSYSSYGLFESIEDGAVAVPVAEGWLENELIATADDFLAAFGETAHYFPAGYVGEDGREILAIVERLEPSEIESAPFGHSVRLEVSVKNNSTGGIASSEINLGFDKIKIADRIGETALLRRITNIIRQDKGMLRLELR